ncbi:helix-turn-helix domain-containing protein [Georgenia alba]|uniref:Helix-turn-helix domain-containing protein n=1 Tax=Georgenia alba TaxID=2233858 RepID=A0ABW2QCI3_9MICO
MVLQSEDRPSGSPCVERVWRGHISGLQRMSSVAASTWELVFWDDGGIPRVSVRGPETVATTVETDVESASWGIIFRHGTTMPHLPVARLVDSEVESPHVTARTFVLRSEEWETPTYDNAEVFVDRLVRAGVLARDPLVADVLAGDRARLGARSVQRRVRAATGLTQGAIRQIERAREATMLLRGGTAALDVVHGLGYYDQPHLARSLSRFIGRTATELRQHRAEEPMSLLYKIGDGRPA